MLFLTVSVGKKYPARNSAVTAQVNTADPFFIQIWQAQFFNYKNYANVSYMVETLKIENCAQDTLIHLKSPFFSQRRYQKNRTMRFICCWAALSLNNIQAVYNGCLLGYSGIPKLSKKIIYSFNQSFYLLVQSTRNNFIEKFMLQLTSNCFGFSWFACKLLIQTQ